MSRSAVILCPIQILFVIVVLTGGSSSAFVPSLSTTTTPGGCGGSGRVTSTSTSLQQISPVGKADSGSTLASGRRRRRMAPPMADVDDQRARTGTSGPTCVDTPRGDSGGAGAWVGFDRRRRSWSLNEKRRASTSRRHALVYSSSLLLSIAAAAPARDAAAALDLPFGMGSSSSPSSRRQLELCLVAVLRVSYWARSVVSDLDDNLLSLPPSEAISDGKKRPYLEARLGAKALLTGRVGGGAPSRVYNLASLQLRGCLSDGAAWQNDLLRRSGYSSSESRVRRKIIDDAATDLVESLGSVVEFDGLETTLDPSPRSSLMLSMFSRDKAVFVRRMLAERTVPSCNAFVDCFGIEVRGRCEAFVRDNYPSEIPRQQQSQTQPAQEA